MKNKRKTQKKQKERDSSSSPTRSPTSLMPQKETLDQKKGSKPKHDNGQKATLEMEASKVNPKKKLGSSSVPQLQDVGATQSQTFVVPSPRRTSPRRKISVEMETAKQSGSTVRDTKNSSKNLSTSASAKDYLKQSTSPLPLPKTYRIPKVKKDGLEIQKKNLCQNRNDKSSSISSQGPIYTTELTGSNSSQKLCATTTAAWGPGPESKRGVDRKSATEMLIKSQQSGFLIPASVHITNKGLAEGDQKQSFKGDSPVIRPKPLKANRQGRGSSRSQLQSDSKLPEVKLKPLKSTVTKEDLDPVNVPMPSEQKTFPDLPDYEETLELEEMEWENPVCDGFCLMCNLKIVGRKSSVNFANKGQTGICKCSCCN